MKKITTLILTMALLMSCLVACDIHFSIGESDDDRKDVEQEDDEEDEEESDDEGSTTTTEESVTEEPTEMPAETTTTATDATDSSDVVVPEGALVDGLYYGSIERISEDFGTAVVLVGEHYTIDTVTVLNASVGDEIIIDGYDGEPLIVNEIYYDYLDRPNLDFGNGYYTSYYEETDCYGVMGMSDIPVTTEKVEYTIDIADGCQIVDFHSVLTDMDASEPWEGTDFAACPWVEYTTGFDFYDSNDLEDGWYDIHGLVLPIEVVNGEIAYIELTFR